MAVLAAADLQDHLFVTGNDLDQLQCLLDDANSARMSPFVGATQLIEDAPLRPNPVTQDEMDAGSVELF